MSSVQCKDAEGNLYQGILIDLEVKERFLSTLKLTKSGVNKKSKKHFREAKCSALQS